ncbi:hypothetical protein EW145_g6078 [Phellinidium pouzarii]|uniref:DNA polymerase lambda n=1 Tax=Phellinidium pouzarii TaxID=167371 RepID=A0A4S4L2K1_9AGAM|nr:hypothetical protein EW145_g6078 [Phellinidium pouzarii]
MDNLQEFFARQRAIAEMSDEDIDEYEARVRRGNRRRNLWKSDETSANSLQSAREATYFASSVGLLSPRDLSSDTSYDYDVENKSRPSSSRKEDAACGESSSIMPGSPDTHVASTSTVNSAPASRTNRVHSASREASGSACNEDLRDAALLRRDHAPPSLTPVPVSPLADNTHERRANTDGNSNQTFKDQDSCPMSPRPQLSDDTMSSKNHKGSLREQVLKKINISGNDKQNVSIDSNVTSPSTTPLVPPSPPTTLTGRHRMRRTLESERKARKAEKARKEAEDASRRKEEARDKLMTPTEYVLKVQSKFAASLEKTPPEQLFLREKIIFYVGGDLLYAVASTRKRMDILRQKGATVVPTYDPNIVTHIVTSADKKTTSKALGLKSIEDIPMHIPTVTWEWVLSGNKGALDYEFMHAAFPSRIHADPSKATFHQTRKGKGKVLAAPHSINPVEEEFSHIEDFPVAKHTTPHDAATSNTKGSSRAPMSEIRLSSHDSASSPGPPAGDDPLSEFYAQARKDRDTEVRYEIVIGEYLLKPSQRMQEFEKGSEDESQSPMPIVKAYLLELKELHKSKLGSEEHWRVFSYGKSIRAIRNYPKRIRSYSEAIAIKGIGEKTALKIKEIVETGDLKRIEYDNTEDVKAINLFNDVYSVGPNTAYKWYASGCRTLEDVRQRKGEITLSPVQELGLKFFDGKGVTASNINTRIPRSEVTDIFNMIKAIALKIDPRLFIEIMGSYRRGKETCGDIDILITRPTDDGRTHRGVLRRLLKEMHLHGILTEDLAMPDDLDDLEATYRGLCRRDQSSRRRRIDILVVMYESRGAALMYYTGDDIVNLYYPYYGLN